jgi:hypothetical protein
MGIAQGTVVISEQRSGVPEQVTIVLFVNSALLRSMKAPPMIDGVSVFGATGYLLAAYLVWRLLRVIK